MATHVLDVYCVCVHTAQCTCSTGHKQCTCHKTKHLTMKNQTRHQRFVKFRVDFKRCLYFVFWNWASLKTSQKQTIILDISRRSPHIIILANLLNLQYFPLIYLLKWSILGRFPEINIKISNMVKNEKWILKPQTWWNTRMNLLKSQTYYSHNFANLHKFPWKTLSISFSWHAWL